MVSRDLEVVAEGLQFPEGPISLADGSLLVTEIRGGTLTRIGRDGNIDVVCHLGGGPNGAAIGPDGMVYVCNNGGSIWHAHDGITYSGTPTEDINQTGDYSGGRIERVDLRTGKSEVLFTECGNLALRAPNDLVFDKSGGFWFTDFGKRRLRERDRTGVFYAQPDNEVPGSYILSEVLFPLNGPNGIGLSPDEKVLYVAETETARLWSWPVLEPGRLKLAAYRPWRGMLVGARCDGVAFDSLAVDGEGNIAVATLGKGAITVFSPTGEVLEIIDTGDPVTTNICFGGEGLKKAYITCAGTGRVLQMTWPWKGLGGAFSA